MYSLIKLIGIYGLLPLTLLLGNSCTRPGNSPYARNQADRSLASVKGECVGHIEKVAKKGHLYHDLERVRRIPEALINGKDKMILNSMIWSNHDKPVYVYLVKTRKNGDPYLYAYLVEERKKGLCHITNILPVNVEEEIDLDEIKLKE